MDRISLVRPNALASPGRGPGPQSAAAMLEKRLASVSGSIGTDDQQRFSHWGAAKLSMASGEKEGSSNGRVSSISVSSASFSGDLSDLLAKEVAKITVRAAGELEAVWVQVGSHDTDGAKMRVVNQMLSAVKAACEACVRQERDTRDSIVAHIDEAKGDILDLSRKLGVATPRDGEPSDEFFYGKHEISTLFDRLATLEMTLDNLRAQQGDRSRTVDALVKEMETINANMDREPEEGEFEETGGSDWEGKEGWELSEERMEKLRGRLATLRVLKFERATEMVGLVVDCQKLFRQLGLTETNPLQTKMLMSLDPSSPVEKPTLRTEDQTQTSVGLSAFNVDRLKKMRQDMQEDVQLHTTRKEQHRQQIEALWDKLSVSQTHRELHLASTKGITHANMDQMEAELARLRKLKAEKLTDMLKAARDEISDLLETVGAKAEEVLGGSARDLHVSSSDWTEDLLEAHEDHLAKLRTMKVAAAPILDRVKRREDLVQKREHLDSFNFDYRARGGVLSQAKVIDGIKKELKKLLPLTDDLRKRLKDWQDTEGFPFRYKGREYLKVIEESDMQWQHRKETRQRARVGAGPGSNGSGPSSPARAAIQNGTFHSTGSMAFGSGAGATLPPGHHRQHGGRVGGAVGNGGGGIGSANGNGFLAFPSPRARGAGGGGGREGGSAWGSGHLSAASSAARGIVGRTGSGSSSGSVFSAGGGPMVDSRTSGHHGSGGEGTAGAGGGGDSAKDLVSKSLPCTPQKEKRNPLLTSFTPSPTLKGLKPKTLGGIFASTGGSYARLPPPPLPARPPSKEIPQAMSRMNSSPDLVREGAEGPAAADGGAGASGGTKAGTTGAGSSTMPPPLPARPASAVFEKADLQAIRESNASSLRSSASASDLLSGGRRTETTR